MPKRSVKRAFGIGLVGGFLGGLIGQRLSRWWLNRRLRQAMKAMPNKLAPTTKMPGVTWRKKRTYAKKFVSGEKVDKVGKIPPLRRILARWKGKTVPSKGYGGPVALGKEMVKKKPTALAKRVVTAEPSEKVTARPYRPQPVSPDGARRVTTRPARVSQHATVFSPAARAVAVATGGKSRARAVGVGRDVRASSRGGSVSGVRVAGGRARATGGAGGAGGRGGTVQGVRGGTARIEGAHVEGVNITVNVPEARAHEHREREGTTQENTHETDGEEAATRANPVRITQEHGWGMSIRDERRYHALREKAEKLSNEIAKAGNPKAREKARKQRAKVVEQIYELEQKYRSP